MEMKASGSYVSRGLSWAGAAFETTEVPLDGAAKAVYDAAARWWARLRAALRDAEARTGDKRGGRMFWGCHQRFFRELCVCLKVPTVIERARRSLADGHAVVVGIQSTGETALTRGARTRGRSPAGR